MLKIFLKKLKIYLLKKVYKIILLKLNNDRAILNAMKQEFFINQIMNVMLVKMNLLEKIINTLKINPHIKSSLKYKEKFFISHTEKDVENNNIIFYIKNLDDLNFKLRFNIINRR